MRFEEQVYACRARGIFRKEKRPPLVGDFVHFSIQDGQEKEGMVEEILPRKNQLLRPPLANIDKLFIVSAISNPAPDTLAIDKLAAIAETQKIEPVMVFTKCDLGSMHDFVALYRKAGFLSFSVSSVTGEGMNELCAQLSGVCVFTGNSGVGKSSLLNRIAPKLSLQVGEVSRKLGRGRHTTRIVEIFRFSDAGLNGDGYLADTPGFSALNIAEALTIPKEELALSFRDFAPFLGQCQFRSCVHVREDGCAVREAVRNGEVSSSRHKSYCTIYEALKARKKEWESKK
ncbi:MAG TPA: ribosome small subunit-dependent GTPase A [Ruminococcaceae bacterium]|nr:ribosome small subunit-dependent GTPase A [Oscillospiraceae bacterium]